MAKVGKEDLRELLIEKYNIEKKDYQIIDKIVEELYDGDRKTVMPLTKLETKVFRKRYGINSTGSIYPIPEIGKQLNIDGNKILYIIGVCFTKLSFRINKIEHRVKESKMSSFDIEENEDVFINDMNLNTNILNAIMRQGIYTLRELLEYSKAELNKLLSKKVFETLVEYVHVLGYLFIDELAIVDQQKIVAKSTPEQINNSSIYFINGVKNLDSRILSKMNATNIRDFILKINFLDKNNKAKILKDIIFLNIPIKNISDYTMEELYKSSIIILGIPESIYANLIRFGIEKIGDLISLEKLDVKRILQNNDKAKYLINKVHSLGLVFKDEMEIMRIYSEEIEEETKKHM